MYAETAPYVSRDYVKKPPSGGYGDPLMSGGFDDPHMSGDYDDSHTSVGYGDPHTSGGCDDSHTSGGFGDPHASRSYDDSHMPKGYNNPHTTGGYGDPHTNGGYDDQHTSDGYDDQHTSGGYDDQHTSGGYGDPRTKGGYDEQHTSGGYDEQHTSGGYEDQHTSGGYDSACYNASHLGVDSEVDGEAPDDINNENHAVVQFETTKDTLKMSGKYSIYLSGQAYSVYITIYWCTIGRTRIRWIIWPVQCIDSEVGVLNSIPMSTIVRVYSILMCTFICRQTNFYYSNDKHSDQVNSLWLCIMHFIFMNYFKGV